MKLYSAFLKKNKDEKIEDVVLVKEGFSFLAFLFGPFWFLSHKMWQEFFILFVLSICFSLFGKILSGFDLVFLEISLAFIVALNANYWVCEKLKKENYQFEGLVFGSNRPNAKLRFTQGLSFDVGAFDDSILNPKLNRKKIRLQNPKKWFFA